MKKKEFIIGIILLIVIGNVVGFLMDYAKEERLKSDTGVTFGVYDREIKSAYSGSVWVFNYELNQINYSIKEHNLTSNLKQGDTVLIEYSLEDLSVARVIDYKYMEKYKDK
jgi:hypothetical protein